MDGRHFIWLVPAGMLLVALAPLPYGYYTLLRIVVFGTGAYIAWWAARGRVTGWTVAFALVAALFNPIIPVYLNRAIWAPIDIAVAALFLVHWLVARKLFRHRGDA